uniref:RNA-dependent RNA polymerase n=1 Tax=Sclerotinia sclerotiorum mitovirus 9-A TaxID=2231694 RepID=A0A2Z4QKH5_9VIRU|nr:RNA-dependent RNA polymerase [Sclerotinia sclerotiorum mitovirus 9-A]
MRINKINFYKLKSSLDWIASIYFAHLDPKLLAAAQASTLSRFEKIYTTRGRVAAADEMKANRLCLTRWKSGFPIKEKTGTPISKIDFLPKVLPLEVRKALRKSDPDHDLFRWCLTLMSISRIVMGGKPINTSSITAPWTGSKLPGSAEIAIALRALGVTREERPIWKRFQWVSSAGPNGLSIARALSDLMILPDDLRSNLYTLGGPILESAMTKIHGWMSKAVMLVNYFAAKPPKTSHLRRLSIKPDSEGKSRPFAIVEYWTQAALTPLHDLLYKKLKEIPADCTFDQQKGVVGMMDNTSQWKYSLDLSSATDRFPIEIQRTVLTWMIDAEYANSWVDAMVKHPFAFQGEDLFFRTGQPLGAKSSWAMFTLSHHVIVQIAKHRCGSNAKYYILGDDIVISTKKLATAYLEIMAEIGVQISEAKSHKSKDLFEFAKTWGFGSRHVSGFPIKGVYTTLHRYQQLVPVLIDVAPMRGYPLPFSVGNLDTFVSSLTSIMTRYDRLKINLHRKIVIALPFALATKDLSSEWTKKFLDTAYGKPLMLGDNEASELFLRTLQSVVVEGKKRELSRLHNFINGLADIGWTPYQSLAAREGRSETIEEIKERYAPSASNSWATLPVLGALEKSSLEGLRQLSQYTWASPLQFWEDFKSWDLEPFPQLKGLAPERIKTRSQAVISLASKASKLVSKVAEIRTCDS